MKIPMSLTLTEDQHQQLKSHLFPGDGLEAVAFIACGHARGADRHRLVARYIHLVEHDRCKRTRNRVDWQAEDILLLADEAEIEGLSLIKIHSHPQGYAAFSKVDDESDEKLLPLLQSWIGDDVPQGSLIMLPDGRIFGRYVAGGKGFVDFDLINVVGPDLKFWWAGQSDQAEAGFGASQDQAFGEGTTKRLRRLRIGIVGASGTGSPVIEQLMRLGVGHLVLVDDDDLEDRNLNRIIFATAEDAEKGAMKVLAAEADILRKGLGTIVTPIVGNVSDPTALRELSLCDVIFGCVDTAYGRFIINLAATHYNIAYFDLGILLDAVQEGAERGRIRNILGTVHYLIPGRSSLLSRQAISMEDVKTERLHKSDPKAAQQQIDDKYIKGLQVRRPAVVSVNMFASALAVNDFLARLHNYRNVDNSEIASIEFSLAELRLTRDEELEDCLAFKRHVGVGDTKYWLGLPELGKM